VPHYACLDSKRRGKAICINRVALRQDLLEHAVLEAIVNALDPTVLAQAVEKALARLARRPRAVIDRRAQVERELAQVQQRLDRLSMYARTARYQLMRSRHACAPRRRGRLCSRKIWRSSVGW